MKGEVKGKYDNFYWYEGMGRKEALAMCAKSNFGKGGGTRYPWAGWVYSQSLPTITLHCIRQKALDDSFPSAESRRCISCSINQSINHKNVCTNELGHNQFSFGQTARRRSMKVVCQRPRAHKNHNQIGSPRKPFRSEKPEPSITPLSPPKGPGRNAVICSKNREISILPKKSTPLL